MQSSSFAIVLGLPCLVLGSITALYCMVIMPVGEALLMCLAFGLATVISFD